VVVDAFPTVVSAAVAAFVSVAADVKLNKTFLIFFYF